MVALGLSSHEFEYVSGLDAFDDQGKTIFQHRKGDCDKWRSIFIAGDEKITGY
jgi:hypothetical protein